VGVTGLLSLTPASPAQTAPGTPDNVTSPNVSHIGSFKPVGDGVGARIIGNRMFVTSTTHLSVLDITTPETPKVIGTFTLDVEFENEDVPTNGKILGISASTFGVNCSTPSALGSGCLNLYDVSGTTPTLIKSVMGAGNHTQDCVLDCTYFYGSEGTIVDARDPKNAKVIPENWMTIAEEQGVAFEGSGHDVTEVANGYIVTATQPILLMSLLEKDGGSPTKPKVISQGNNEDGRFIHSTLWPNKGKDKFILIGGETVLNAQQCSDTSAAFMVWDASKLVDAKGDYVPNATWELRDEVRMRNGTFTDSFNPYNVFGCSVHWFNEHPTFKDGGLVAVSAYEHGTRLYQVTPEGKLVEQGFALPAAGAASAPYWAPNGKVFYTIDYQRGMDIWSYTGDTYVPDPKTGKVPPPAPGTTPGTNGAPSPEPAQCASAAGFKNAGATPAGKGVRFDVERREEQKFTVDVFQQSAGKTVVKERLVARFKNKSAGFTWNGKDRKKRALKNGNYFVRFTMKLKNGATDVRRVTLSRKGGKFRKAKDFYQRVDCGIFKSLKLSSSVFGSRKRVPLGISYKLELPARSVTIKALVGKKTVKTFKGKGTKGKTFRFSLPAKAVRAGRAVKVLVTVDRGGTPPVSVTLHAKRL
jgi:hypothetical protein